jgi:hypothetical protein
MTPVLGAIREGCAGRAVQQHGDEVSLQQGVLQCKGSNHAPVQHLQAEFCSELTAQRLTLRLIKFSVN